VPKLGVQSIGRDEILVSSQDDLGFAAAGFWGVFMFAQLRKSATEQVTHCNEVVRQADEIVI
jgi:hypothetical protein